MHYRKLRRADGSFPEAKSLSQAISDALLASLDGGRVIDKWKSRIANIPEGYQCVLNDIVIKDNYVFGDLCLFSSGQMQALLKMAEENKVEIDPENPSLAEVLAAMEIAETKAPLGHEYLHAICYWMAIDDHLYHIQHVSLQAKSVEDYLTWLLRDKCEIIEKTHYVALDVKFDRSQIGEDLGNIKSVEIGGIVPETAVVPNTPAKLIGKDIEISSSLADRIGAKMQKARNIITELLGDVEAEKLIASVPDEASLEVTVNIGYKSTKRKFSKEFMSNLAAGLRNIPDGEIKIRGKDGEIKGNDARLSADMSIKKIRPDSSLLDLAHVQEQLLEVHRRFAHDGEISVDKSK